MQIFTHRGLEPLNSSFCFSESSEEAFKNQLTHGFGLEFDINFSKEKWPFIFHDGNLSRISFGKDNRKFTELTEFEIKHYELPYLNHFIGFEALVSLIHTKRKPGEFSALHLKSIFQDKDSIDSMINILKKTEGIEQKIFVFDVTIETARYIKSIFPELQLFPSVAHPYDIERFNRHTGGTLLTLDEVLTNKNIFDGVWLDEWDKKDMNGSKILYTKEIFDVLRKHNLKIGLVTPELHGKSPGLLGGESHEDSENTERLQKRFQEIIKLAPDYICTDYPHYILGK